MKNTYTKFFSTHTHTHTHTQVTVSFFEIYGGRCQDLLNNRNRLVVREDGQGDVCVADLTEIPVDTKVSLEVRTFAISVLT